MTVSTPWACLFAVSPASSTDVPDVVIDLGEVW